MVEGPRATAPCERGAKRLRFAARSPLVVLCALLWFSACVSTEVPRANPLDPKNPAYAEGGYDPYQLQAKAEGNAIMLTWKRLPPPLGDRITGYLLYHRTDTTAFTTPLAELPATATKYLHLSLPDATFHRYTIVYQTYYETGNLNLSPEVRVEAMVDTDGDGVRDTQDEAADDNRVCHDQDGDGCDECASGKVAAPSADGPDLDHDGRCDAGDDDQDGDGVSDANDSHPREAAHCHDLDDDGCDECAAGAVTAPLQDGTDLDHDGLCDAGDDDQDGDGVPDTEDEAPLDRLACHDHDNDECNECR